MATKPKAYEQPAYTSEYQGRLDSALDSVTNRQEFTYDPLKDANYQALSKLYNKQGEQAAQNTLGDAAALILCCDGFSTGKERLQPETGGTDTGTSRSGI